MFEVPGGEAAFEENQSVPHGEIRMVWYPSSTLGMQRRMHVYTPPGYDRSSARYPVFYLLHGGGDDDSGWSTIGRAGFIWRWNMPLGEAFRTCALRRCGAHGYVTAGPLIVEW